MIPLPCLPSRNKSTFWNLKSCHSILKNREIFNEVKKDQKIMLEATRRAVAFIYDFRTSEEIDGVMKKLFVPIFIFKISQLLLYRLIGKHKNI